MGISIRAYARHRGVSDAAVRKAIAAGRITPEADGTIDAERVDREWARNSDAPRNGTATRAVKVAAVNNRVRFDAAQSLTVAEQLQARSNIGAVAATDVGNTDTDFVAVFVGALV